MAVDKNFVVKNGLEVNTDLILANANTNQVGIATTNPQYTLHVNGGIGVTNAYVTGIATFATDLVVAGTLTANASAGSTGQYLKSTATGVEWASFPNVRTSTFFTATEGQTNFSFSYTPGLVDVFVNGVKLANTEYVATDGISVVLNNACFGGEVIELIGYGTTGIGAGGTGIAGITIQEEGVTTGNTAAVNSINFVGAAVTAVGTGAGVTVYISGGSGGGGGESYWTQTAAGIHTLSNVGVGTTNPRFTLEVGAVGASGTSLWVNGNARVTGILTIGTSSIVLDGSSNTINVGTGITIEGDTGVLRASEFYADGVQVGIITADTIIYQGGTLENLWTSNATGIHTTSNVGVGTTNAEKPLTVYGDIKVTGGGDVIIDEDSAIYFNASDASSPYIEYQDNAQKGLQIVNGTGNDTFVVVGSGNTFHIQEDVISSFSPNRVASFDYTNGINFYKNVNAGIITATQFIGAASSVTVLANNSSATTHYVGFFTNTSGSNNILSDSTLQYVPSTNTLTAGTFDGNISANNITSGTLDNARLPASVSLSGNLSVAGVSTFSDYVSVAGTASFRTDIGSGVEFKNASGGALVKITADGGTTAPRVNINSAYLQGNSSGDLDVWVPSNAEFITLINSIEKFRVSGFGATVTGTTFTDQLSVSGVSTFSGSVGIGTTNPTSALTVQGDVLVSGVSTFGNPNIATDNLKISNVGDVTLQPGRLIYLSGNTNVGIRWTSALGMEIYNGNNLGGDDRKITIQSLNEGDIVLKGQYDNRAVFTNNGVTVTGITSTQDLIVYGNGNESGSISTVALMSRNNYIDFGPAIPNTSAPQQFALRLGSDRAPGTFGVYNILGASYAAPSGSVFLNNWDGTSAISISDNGVFVTPKPLIVGTATSTGTASQTLQVTGGAYVSGSVGIGTINPTEKLTVRGGDISVGVNTSTGLILTSPNGTRYRLIVDNSGNLSTTAV